MSSITEFMADISSRVGVASGAGSASLAAILAMEAELPAMSDADKSDDNRFHGCQSQIWLKISRRHDDGAVLIAADSDARIVRGLLAIAIGMYSGRQPEEIAAHPPLMLREAGLIDALAPSRANGFYRLLQHIHREGGRSDAAGRGRVA